MLNIFKYQPSLESIVDGNAHIEKELVYYAILKDKSILDKAAKKELQEQWEIKIPKIEEGVPVERNICGGTLRVRKINEGERYIFCSKTKCSEGTTEVELESTKDQFEQFVKMAVSGMLKTRYYFPIQGTEGSFPEGEFDGCMVWEIDVFKDRVSGNDVEWVKIDLEFPENLGREKAPDFPFETEKLITDQYPNRTPEDEAIVSRLYEQDYKIKH